MMQNNITKEALALVGDNQDSPVFVALRDVLGEGATITKADVLRVYTAYRYSKEWEYFKTMVALNDVIHTAEAMLLDGVRLGRLTGVDASEMGIRDWITFLDHVYGDETEWWLRNDDTDEDSDDD